MLLTKPSPKSVDVAIPICCFQLSLRIQELFFCEASIGTFRGATGTLPPGPTPLAPTQLNPSART